MPQLRFRLTKLALLIAILALATDLFMQWRREIDFIRQVRAPEKESARDQRTLERLAHEVARQRQLKEQRTQVPRSSGEGKDNDGTRHPTRKTETPDR
jgi:hypothetical protein